MKYHRGFEPYIVGTKKDIPLYDTAFVGRVQNKISHLLMFHAVGFVCIYYAKIKSTFIVDEKLFQLNVRKFDKMKFHCRLDFLVLPDVFTIHLPHPSASSDIEYKRYSFKFLMGPK